LENIIPGLHQTGNFICNGPHGMALAFISIFELFLRAFLI